MVRIQTRQQLLNWITAKMQDLGRCGIVRALEDTNSMVRVLGGFSSMPPSTAPGWVVSIVSRHGKVWHVSVTVRQNGYGCFLLERIPWKNWVGGKSELYAGDNPARYERLRDAACKVAH
jgi:hypothetical protein